MERCCLGLIAMNRYLFLLLLTCLTAWSATFQDTSTDQQVIINSNNVSAGSSSLRWSFTNTRLTVGPTGLGSRVDVEGATPAWRLYAGGNPAASYSRLEGFWDSGAQTYYLRENVSGSNAIPFVVGINSGALLTFNTDGTATHSGGLGLSGATNRLSIANDTLLLDGVPIASNTTTNTYNTQIITNVFFQNGRGNTLIVTQALTIQAIKTNLLATDATGLITNAVYGTGIAWDPATRTISSTASGGGVSTAVVPLAYSGTNITGFNCATNNTTYTLLLTNVCLFGTSTFASLQNTTTNHFFTLGLQQDSAGGWVPKFTNSIVTWAEGVQPVITTNGGAVSYLYFHTHLFTNGMLVGSPNLNIK